MTKKIFPQIWKLVPKKHWKKIGFQQDGAPCHTTHAVADLLEKNFGDRVIARNYATWKNKGVNWSGNSPDLSPLDFAINPILKKKIFEGKAPKTLKELERKCVKVLKNWDLVELKKCIFSVVTRSVKCAAQNGGHFEHLE